LKDQISFRKRPVQGQMKQTIGYGQRVVQNSEGIQVECKLSFGESLADMFGKTGANGEDLVLIRQ